LDSQQLRLLHDLYNPLLFAILDTLRSRKSDLIMITGLIYILISISIYRTPIFAAILDPPFKVLYSLLHYPLVHEKSWDHIVIDLVIGLCLLDSLDLICIVNN
jgi:hypothetical protein